MSTIRSLRLVLVPAALCVVLCSLAASLARAGSDFHEVHPADASGSVEIYDIADPVEVIGWDRSEVDVTGPPTDGLGSRVQVTTAGSRTSIRVRPGGGGDAHLVIRVPAKSSLEATLMSANLKVSGIFGDADLRTLSGNISGEVGGNLWANTATGKVQMTARGARSIEVKTISGDVQLAGGSGEVEVKTVSGDAKVELATLSHGRFKTISGNLATSLSLAPDAELEGESVSGNIRFDFPAPPQADFDIESFSGNIDNCFGPKSVEPRHGPGSRLMFKSGNAQAHVRVVTKSGDIRLCTGPPSATPSPNHS